MEWSELPPLSALRAFEAVGRHLNLSSAGRELNVTHSAVSQQVKRLEEQLGHSLIVREKGGVALTSMGRQLAAILTEGLGQIKDGLAEILTVDDDPPLYVTTTPSFAAHWLIPRLVEFKQANPDVELFVDADNRLTDLAKSEYDLAIRYGDGNWPGFRSEQLMNTGTVVVAAPELLGNREFIEPKDLMKLPWIEDLSAEEEFPNWLRRNDVDPGKHKNRIHISGAMLRSALLAGQGVGLTTRAMIQEDIENGRLIVLFDAERPDFAKAGYFLVWRKGTMRPTLQKFKDWLHNLTAEQAVEQN